MDCCNYGEYRGLAHGQYAGWEGYSPYAPLPYAPYSQYYAPHAHDPYARYYRYDYPHHLHHNEHVMPMDYGAYASKESRVRRAIARREQRATTPAPHLQHPPTPPLECGMNGRNPSYCEPHMWPHYQMGVLGGSWNGASAASWASRGACAREHMRYAADCRSMKSPHPHIQNQACMQDGRSTPYRPYAETTYNGDCGARQGSTSDYTSSVTPSEPSKVPRERFYPAPRRSPPEEKRPPVVPLPAFQQAFGSTEIGKFAEAFSRAEVALENIASDTFVYESFSDWDASLEPQWPASQPASREIKCEENF
ncbi:uncharacterized protein LOC106134246 [Amyelois transitella]|uniref:uncharacterized protein LOC106134246 n=1 Tax=Amyelois transitella TaxID=680683 RepID=UPI00067CC36E|nr:uncharacterized protein LOC106134246 [Amyelois transitella]